MGKAEVLGAKEFRFKFIPIDRFIHGDAAQYCSKYELDEMSYSIESTGLHEPLVVTEAKGGMYEVIEGRKRFFSLLSLGAVEVPSLVHPGMSADEATVIANTMNSKELRQFCVDDIGDSVWELEDLRQFSLGEELDIGSPEYKEEEEIRPLVADSSLDEFEVCPLRLAFNVRNNSKTSLKYCDWGDWIEVGEHKIYCGPCDTAEARKWLDEVGVTSKCRCAIFDTPEPTRTYYYDKKTGRYLAWNKCREVPGEKEYDEFIHKGLELVKYAIRDKSSYYIFYDDSNMIEMMTAMKDVGLKFKQTVVWIRDAVKPNYKKTYIWKHDLVAFGENAEDMGEMNKLDVRIAYGAESSRSVWTAGRNQSSVIDVDLPRGVCNPLDQRKCVRDMKPLNLIGYFIGNNTYPKELVFDPVAGLGSTLMACEQMRRRACTIEVVLSNVILTLLRFGRYTKWEKPIIRHRGSSVIDMRELLKQTELL